MLNTIGEVPALEKIPPPRKPGRRPHKRSRPKPDELLDEGPVLSAAAMKARSKRRAARPSGNQYSDWCLEHAFRDRYALQANSYTLHQLGTFGPAGPCITLDHNSAEFRAIAARYATAGR